MCFFGFPSWPWFYKKPKLFWVPCLNSLKLKKHTMNHSWFEHLGGRYTIVKKNIHPLSDFINTYFDKCLSTKRCKMGPLYYLALYTALVKPHFVNGLKLYPFAIKTWFDDMGINKLGNICLNHHRMRTPKVLCSYIYILGNLWSIVFFKTDSCRPRHSVYVEFAIGLVNPWLWNMYVDGMTG